MSVIELIEESNTNPSKSELGSKNYNSLILDKISNEFVDKNGKKMF